MPRPGRHLLQDRCFVGLCRCFCVLDPGGTKDLEDRLDPAAAVDHVGLERLHLGRRHHDVDLALVGAELGGGEHLEHAPDPAQVQRLVPRRHHHQHVPDFRHLGLKLGHEGLGRDHLAHRLALLDPVLVDAHAADPDVGPLGVELGRPAVLNQRRHGVAYGVPPAVADHLGGLAHRVGPSLDRVDQRRAGAAVDGAEGAGALAPDDGGLDLTDLGGGRVEPGPLHPAQQRGCEKGDAEAKEGEVGGGDAGVAGPRAGGTALGQHPLPDRDAGLGRHLKRGGSSCGAREGEVRPAPPSREREERRRVTCESVVGFRRN